MVLNYSDISEYLLINIFNFNIFKYYITKKYNISNYYASK